MKQGTVLWGLVNGLVAAAIAVVAAVVIYALTVDAVPVGFVVTVGIATGLITFAVFMVISTLAKRRRR